MARKLKPYFLPELWMTMGGRRLPHTGDGSRLGEESREEGFEDRERGDRGLMRGPPLPSSVGIERSLPVGPHGAASSPTVGAGYLAQTPPGLELVPRRQCFLL